MPELYEKGNPLKATKVGTTTQASKNTDNEDAFEISSDVATPICEKGIPDSTLNSDVPISDKKTRVKRFECCHRKFCKHGCW